MTAGRGIVHCEMPVGTGLTQGLQLWVNLAKKYKMVEPAYQELVSKDIPVVERDGVKVRVIAGESMGVKVSMSLILLKYVGHCVVQLWIVLSLPSVINTLCNSKMAVIFSLDSLSTLTCYRLSLSLLLS